VGAVNQHSKTCRPTKELQAVPDQTIVLEYTMRIVFSMLMEVMIIYNAICTKTVLSAKFTDKTKDKPNTVFNKSPIQSMSCWKIGRLEIQELL
jgi:hypothetical protein